jgi:predicted nucleic acid-binding protein
MNPVFADTFVFLAMLTPGSFRHAASVRWLASSRHPLVLTEWILTELGDGLCRRDVRDRYVRMEQRLRADHRVTIVPATAALFGRGTHLYQRRPDKDWSLTDCISFVVMQEFAITEALTGDHHFEQAGFVALLK